MKKLLFLSVLLSAMVGCSRDDAADPSGAVGGAGCVVPHVYGLAMPQDGVTDTRGVAVTTKVWSKPNAEKNLTVKFLNGTDRYRELVREMVGEWEKNAGVRFFFVGDDEPAMIRVGFDYIPGMMSSWALTGTDHLQAYNRQSEPTVHFAQWRRASDALKRSDVLRAFGQVLGLELEFRHPKFHPTWITDADGNIDQARIRAYWENELAGYMSWEELKKVVFDPIADPDFLIAKTADYDPQSVMNWPFYEMIADNIPLIEFDEDYKTALSESDKLFIGNLYGPSLKGMPLDDEYLPLIDLEYSGDNLSIYLTTTENLVIIWDKDARIFERVDFPAGTAEYSMTYSHQYDQAATRRVIVGQLLTRGSDVPSRSSALTRVELTCNGAAAGIRVANYNDALERFYLYGGENFPGQLFDFTDFRNLREIYLVGTLDSRVLVNNCPKLEVLATSKYVWYPNYIPRPEAGGMSQADSRIVGVGWPINAEGQYALSDVHGPGVTIRNCPNLKAISLENTRIKQIDFSNLPKLEYVYLSSAPEYLVGGGRSVNGDYLYDAVQTLPDRMTSGVLLLRSVGTTVMLLGYLRYEPIEIDRLLKDRINLVCVSSNWLRFWDAPYQTKPDWESANATKLNDQMN